MEWVSDVVESVHFELLTMDECNTAHKLDFQSNHELLCSDKLNWEAGADILSGCIFALLPLPPILLLVCSHFSDWYLCLCLCLYLYLYFCICSFWCIFHTHSHPFPQSFFLYHTFPTATSIYCPENSIPLNLSFYFELFFDKAPWEIYFGHFSLSLNRQGKFSVWVDINIKMLMFPFYEKHHTRQMPVIKSSHKKGLMYHT